MLSPDKLSDFVSEHATSTEKLTKLTLTAHKSQLSKIFGHILLTTTQSLSFLFHDNKRDFATRYLLTVHGISVLAVCQSSISNTSADYNLLVPNGTYVLTADDCIQCKCSASNYEQ